MSSPRKGRQMSKKSREKTIEEHKLLSRLKKLKIEDGDVIIAETDSESEAEKFIDLWRMMVVPFLKAHHKSAFVLIKSPDIVMSRVKFDKKTSTATRSQILGITPDGDAIYLSESKIILLDSHGSAKDLGNPEGLLKAIEAIVK